MSNIGQKHPIKSPEIKIRLGLLDIITLLFSLLILIELLAGLFITFPPQTKRLIHFFDNLICVFFLCTFFYNLYRAPHKLTYLKWGWIDLISSIPNLETLHFGRLIRVIRIIRLLMLFRSSRQIIDIVVNDKKQGTLYTLILVMFLLILTSSIAILEVETAPNSNIKTAEDALWWSYVTITTIGYGDYYPVTRAGRIIAVILIAAGVGVYGTFAGYMSSFFGKRRG